MNFDQCRDHGFTGVLLGAILIPSSYFLLAWFRNEMSEWLSSPQFMASPVHELLTILSGILVARYLMVNRSLERTGKGLLLVVLLTALGYFYISFRFRHAY
jgi:hypothetical protein